MLRVEKLAADAGEKVQFNEILMVGATVGTPLVEGAAVQADVIDLEALKAEHVVGHDAKKVKVINTGAIERKVTVKGLGVTKGAQAAIEAAGGKVE